MRCNLVKELVHIGACSQPTHNTHTQAGGILKSPDTTNTHTINTPVSDGSMGNLSPISSPMSSLASPANIVARKLKLEEDSPEFLTREGRGTSQDTGTGEEGRPRTAPLNGAANGWFGGTVDLGLHQSAVSSLENELSESRAELEHLKVKAKRVEDELRGKELECQLTTDRLVSTEQVHELLKSKLTSKLKAAEITNRQLRPYAASSDVVVSISTFEVDNSDPADVHAVYNIQITCQMEPTLNRHVTRRFRQFVRLKSDLRTTVPMPSKRVLMSNRLQVCA